MRAYLTAPMKQLSIWSLLFTYGSASDEEISQYTNLFEMEPLRQFNDTVKIVIQGVIDRQSLTAGAELRAYAEAHGTHFPAH
jgi:hypothetical protein